MLLSLGFLVLIVLMSAFVAVLADEVGRKLGKKRLSITYRKMHLRPKRVAQIGTALSGAGVSLATILVVAAASKEVREWIVVGNTAIIRAERLTKEVRTLEDQVSRSGRELRERQATLQMREVEIRDQNRRLATQRGEISSGRAQIARQRADLSRVQAEASRLRGQIVSLKREVEAASRRVAAANTRLQSEQARLATVRANLRRVASDLIAARQRLAANKLQIEETTKQRAEVVERNTQLILQTEQLNREAEGLKTQRTTLEADLRVAANELESANADLAQTQTELGRAKAELTATEAALVQYAQASELFRSISRLPRIAPMMFRIKEEVARIFVEPGASTTEGQAALARLLRAARLAAIERGAKPNDAYPEAGIVERVDPRTRLPISVARVEEEFVRRVVGSRVPLVLVATSSLNAFRGEPVALDLTLYPNPVVYRKGQVVAEARIDGRRDEAEILKQITDFLGEKVRERARADKMVPRGGDDSFGSVPSEIIVKLVSSVRAAEREVRVLAMAEADTRAGDPLRLTFQIRV